MVKLKKNKGITLIALIVTIIILLILAGVTIATLTGDNGLLTKTNAAKEKDKQAKALEDIKMKIYEAEMDNAQNGNETKTETEKLRAFVNLLKQSEDTYIVIGENKTAKLEQTDEGKGILDPFSEITEETEKLHITNTKYGYEVVVNKNLTVKETVVASSVSSGSGSETGEAGVVSQEEFANFKKAIAQAIKESGGVDTADDADTTTFVTNIKGILKEVTKNDTAENTDILNGKTTHVNGNTVTGTMANKSNQTTSASTVEKSGTNLLITIPSEGYYATNSKLSVPISTINAQLGSTITSLGSQKNVTSISCSVGDLFLIHTIHSDGYHLRPIGGTTLMESEGPWSGGINSVGGIVRATSTTLKLNGDNPFSYIKLSIQ